jgi:hypothetical protein
MCTPDQFFLHHVMPNPISIYTREFVAQAVRGWIEKEEKLAQISGQ